MSRFIKQKSKFPYFSFTLSNLNKKGFKNNYNFSEFNLTDLPYALIFKNNLISDSDLGPEQIMTLEENCNNSKNIIILKKIINDSCFIIYSDLIKASKIKINCLLNHFILISSKFLENNLFSVLKTKFAHFLLIHLNIGSRYIFQFLFRKILNCYSNQNGLVDHFHYGNFNSRFNNPKLKYTNFLKKKTFFHKNLTSWDNHSFMRKKKTSENLIDSIYQLQLF